MDWARPGLALISEQVIVETMTTTSLRANGSRECAPDDRLREAIHAATRGKNGCFVAYAARNDRPRNGE